MSGLRVTFRPENRSIEVPIGTTLVEAARSAGVDLISPCNGQGTCGRCRVLLPDRGSVLGCQTRLTEDTTVDIPITARSRGAVVHLESTISPESQMDRPIDPLGCSAYGVAVDIGTSTVASELVDLSVGTVVARAGVANRQAAYGAEVTRRIEHAEDHGVAALRDAVIADIRLLIERMCQETEVPPTEVGAIVIAGNTAMVHLLHGLDPAPIRVAPHVPNVESPLPAEASSLELGVACGAQVFSLPWIGGWVGGDISSGILATNMHREDRLTLLIDVGTNGEIVLGQREWRVACAASAGPAFEGCGLRDGTTARPGAIDRVHVSANGEVTSETIGGAPAIGICGTGLISAVAGLFRAGWLDRAGRLDPRRATDLDGEPGVVLVHASASGTGRAIGIVERDIGAMMRAKAALFAGAKSLVEMTEVRFDEIERLIICGGFGSALQPADAVTVGMIPDIDAARIDFVGNAALRGARRALLSRSAWDEATEIARSTTYVELIDRPAYFEEYTSACFLPHTDASLFPRVSNNGRLS